MIILVEKYLNASKKLFTSKESLRKELKCTETTIPLVYLVE